MPEASNTSVVLIQALLLVSASSSKDAMQVVMHSFTILAVALLLIATIQLYFSCFALHSTPVIGPRAASPSPEFASWEIYAYLVRALFPRLSFQSSVFLGLLDTMWESLTYENIDELLTLLPKIPEASNTSVVRLIQALQQHPSLLVSCSTLPASSTTDAGSDALLHNTSDAHATIQGVGRKAGTCCRNGQKVVDIRKARPMVEESISSMDIDTAEPYNGSQEAAVVPDGKDCGEDRDISAMDGKAKANSVVKKSKAREARAPVKGKKKAKSNGRKRSIDLIAEEQNFNPQKKWKTDGQTAVVDLKAEVLIFELATIGERNRGQDFSKFLCSIGSSLHTLPLSDNNPDNTFPLLVSRCAQGENDSAVVDFRHMVSLMLLALYVDRKVNFFLGQKQDTNSLYIHQCHHIKKSTGRKSPSQTRTCM
jgi:hypothetical protein